MNAHESAGAGGEKAPPNVGLLEQMLDAIRSMERSHRTLLDLVKRQAERIEALEVAVDSGSSGGSDV